MSRSPSGPAIVDLGSQVNSQQMPPVAAAPKRTSTADTVPDARSVKELKRAAEDLGVDVSKCTEKAKREEERGE